MKRSKIKSVRKKRREEGNIILIVMLETATAKIISLYNTDICIFGIININVYLTIRNICLPQLIIKIIFVK